MQESAKRPVYLNLLQIRQPIGAVVSITHRITGTVLALATPFALWALHLSLASPSGFERVRAALGGLAGRALVLLLLWLLAQHFYSGVRHLFMDVDLGMELGPARRSGWATYVASVITVLVAGLLLW